MLSTSCDLPCLVNLELGAQAARIQWHDRAQSSVLANQYLSDDEVGPKSMLERAHVQLLHVLEIRPRNVEVVQHLAVMIADRSEPRYHAVLPQ